MSTDRIVGIDLGTTNSLVAFMQGENPVIIPGEDGLNLVPSVVALDENDKIIADNDLVVFIKCDYRRDKVQSVLARNDDRVLPLHERHERVRGAEVDADDAISAHLDCRDVASLRLQTLP